MASTLKHKKVRTRSATRWIIFFAGFLMISAVILIHILFDPAPDPTSAAVYRIILALGAAGISHVFFGFIRVKGTINNLSIQAGGPFAVFCIVLFSFKLDSPKPVETVQVQPKEEIHQTVENGGTGVIHTGSGDIVITGYTKEEHERILKREKEELRADLERIYLEKDEVSTLEKKLAEAKLLDVQRDLAELDMSYQEKIRFLKETNKELRSASVDFDAETLEKAELALNKGDTSEADRLFALIEEKGKDSILRAAKAAFERGKIAENSMDYQKSLLHFERAIQLSPDDPAYLQKAGSMAAIVFHPKEIEWKERALELYLAKTGECSPEVAAILNDLGLAWYSRGEYDKAIEFCSRALAIDLEVFGANHPNVSVRLNNLGLVWNSKGEYDKAIDYYTRALAIDLEVFGANHPNVAVDLNNLGIAWNSKGEHDKAINYYSKALAIDLEIFGENHPTTRIIQSNLNGVVRLKSKASE